MDISGMSEEEVRARTEALELGRCSMIETVLGALLLQVPHPDLVEQATAIRLEELRNAVTDEPGLSWSVEMIHTGAAASAERILQHFRAMRDKRQPRN